MFSVFLFYHGSFLPKLYEQKISQLFSVIVLFFICFLIKHFLFIRDNFMVLSSQYSWDHRNFPIKVGFILDRFYYINVYHMTFSCK
jgi:hypothetical protein